MAQKPPSPRAEQRPLLAFRGAHRAILVSGGEALLPHIPRYLPDWPHDAVAQGPEAADIRVTDSGGRLRIDEGNPQRASADYATALEAANGLTGALIAAYVEQDAALVCLHAAAAAMGQGLVLLVGDTEAGKSSLAVQLTRAGFRSFGDDRLIIRLANSARDEDLGMALGMPLKLRLPLPAEAREELAPYVEARTAARAEGLVQLRLGADEAAGFGALAPIRALVLLDRVKDGVERFDVLPASAMLRALLLQAYAPRLEADARVAALGGLARRRPCYRLTFARSHLAAALLAAQLGKPRAGEQRA